MKRSFYYYGKKVTLDSVYIEKEEDDDEYYEVIFKFRDLEQNKQIIDKTGYPIDYLVKFYYGQVKYNPWIPMMNSIKMAIIKAGLV